ALARMIKHSMLARDLRFADTLFPHQRTDAGHAEVGSQVRQARKGAAGLIEQVAQVVRVGPNALRPIGLVGVGRTDQTQTQPWHDEEQAPVGAGEEHHRVRTEALGDQVDASGRAQEWWRGGANLRQRTVEPGTRGVDGHARRHRGPLPRDTVTYLDPRYPSTVDQEPLGPRV